MKTRTNHYQELVASIEYDKKAWDPMSWLPGLANLTLTYDRSVVESQIPPHFYNYVSEVLIENVFFVLWLGREKNRELQQFYLNKSKEISQRYRSKNDEASALAMEELNADLEKLIIKESKLLIDEYLDKIKVNPEAYLRELFFSALHFGWWNALQALLKVPNIEVDTLISQALQNEELYLTLQHGRIVGKPEQMIVALDVLYKATRSPVLRDKLLELGKFIFSHLPKDQQQKYVKTTNTFISRYYNQISQSKDGLVNVEQRVNIFKDANSFISRLKEEFVNKRADALKELNEVKLDVSTSTNPKFRKALINVVEVKNKKPNEYMAPVFNIILSGLDPLHDQFDSDFTSWFVSRYCGNNNIFSYLALYGDVGLALKKYNYDSDGAMRPSTYRVFEEMLDEHDNLNLLLKFAVFKRDVLLVDALSKAPEYLFTYERIERELCRLVESSNSKAKLEIFFILWPLVKDKVTHKFIAHLEKQIALNPDDEINKHIFKEITAVYSSAAASSSSSSSKEHSEINAPKANEKLHRVAKWFRFSKSTKEKNAKVVERKAKKLFK